MRRGANARVQCGMGPMIGFSAGGANARVQCDVGAMLGFSAAWGQC